MAKTVLKWVGDHKFIVAIDRSMTRQVVAERGKTLGATFASDIVGRICDCIFAGIKDLEDEFAEFYATEYCSFEDFLYWKHGLSTEAISRIMNNNNDSRIIAIGDACGGGDYIVDQLTESEIGKKLLVALLDLDDKHKSEREGGAYEDQE